jgi:hypothetical protein
MGGLRNGNVASSNLETVEWKSPTPYRGTNFHTQIYLLKSGSSAGVERLNLLA